MLPFKRLCMRRIQQQLHNKCERGKSVRGSYLKKKKKKKRRKRRGGKKEKKRRKKKVEEVQTQESAKEAAHTHTFPSANTASWRTKGLPSSPCGDIWYVHMYLFIYFFFGGGGHWKVMEAKRDREREREGEGERERERGRERGEREGIARVKTFKQRSTATSSCASSTATAACRRISSVIICISSFVI